MAHVIGLFVFWLALNDRLRDYIALAAPSGAPKNAA